MEYDAHTWKNEKVTISIINQTVYTFSQITYKILFYFYTYE